MRTNDRSDASYIKQNITDLYADIARVIYMMEHIATKPENIIKTYFKIRQNFKLVEPKLVVHSAHRKVRSDSTAFKTLELFYAGFTIAEIAKKRKITIRTVVKHLRVFIEQDVIHISNFTHTDQQILES